MSYEYGFIGINNIQEKTISTTIQDNLVSFFDWGFLNKGGFFNLTQPSSGLYGGLKSSLKLTTDPNYSDGAVWQGFRQNWVWETGVSTATQPISISGIYINNSFYPYYYDSGTQEYKGSGGYIIDYPNGRVIFDNPISTSSTVSLSYSYKMVKVDKSDEYPFFKQLQSQSFRVDQNFLTSSGNWAKLGETRVQMPSVIVELANEELRPYALGGGQWAEIDFVIYCLAETKVACNNLVNTIHFQKDRTLKLFNSNLISKSGVNPINYKGNLITKEYSYPYLIDNYQNGYVFIKNSTISDSTQLNSNLFMGTVRYTTETKILTLA